MTILEKLFRQQGYDDPPKRTSLFDEQQKLQIEQFRKKPFGTFPREYLWEKISDSNYPGGYRERFRQEFFDNFFRQPPTYDIKTQQPKYRTLVINEPNKPLYVWTQYHPEDSLDPNEYVPMQLFPGDELYDEIYRKYRPNEIRSLPASSSNGKVFYEQAPAESIGKLDIPLGPYNSPGRGIAEGTGLLPFPDPPVPLQYVEKPFVPKEYVPNIPTNVNTMPKLPSYGEYTPYPGFKPIEPFYINPKTPAGYFHKAFIKENLLTPSIEDDVKSMMVTKKPKSLLQMVIDFPLKPMRGIE
jgi:hypothetical protein